MWTALLIISTVLASKLTNMTAKLQQLLFKGSGSDVLVEVGLGIVLTLPLVLAGLALQSPLMESLVPGIQDMKRFLAQNAKPILSECSTLQIVVLAIRKRAWGGGRGGVVECVSSADLHFSCSFVCLFVGP